MTRAQLNLQKVALLVVPCPGATELPRQLGVRRQLLRWRGESRQAAWRDSLNIPGAVRPLSFLLLTSPLHSKDLIELTPSHGDAPNPPPLDPLHPSPVLKRKVWEIARGRELLQSNQLVFVDSIVFVGFEVVRFSV
jgi:hypothetical protein